MYWYWTTPVTDQFGEQLAHHVSDREAALPTHGAIRTVCGQFITPAPMSAPEGELCPRCAINLSLVRPPQARRPQHVVRTNRGCLLRLRRLRGLFTR